MYKVITAFFLLFLFPFVQTSYAVQVSGTIQIMDENNKVIAKKTINYEEGESVLEVTKKAFKIIETEGVITSINEIKDKPKENIHWVAFVDGDFIEISPDEVGLFANDILTWALRDLDQQEIMK